MSGYIGNIPVPQATQTRESFTATASQTTFNTAGYTPNFLDVFLNGVHLLNGTDYTATNGSDVVLTTGAAASDIVEVISYSTYEVNAQTYTGGLTVNNDGATVLTVGRATSDGSIVDFKKSGTTVGSIGNYSGTGNTLLVGSSTSHLAISHDAAAYFPAAGQNTVKDNAIDLGRDISRFKNLYLSGGVVGTAGTRIYSSETNGSGLILSTGVIYPSGNTGATANGQVDLGSAGVKFKDLYLSGGVYLGGTGAANKLDDYEEGTFTPTFTSSSGTLSVGYSSQVGRYTKIGRMVHVTVDIQASGAQSGGSGIVRVSGFPFNFKNGPTLHAGAVAFSNNWVSSEAPSQISGEGNTGFATLRRFDGNSEVNDSVGVGAIQTNSRVYFQITYEADGG